MILLTVSVDRLGMVFLKPKRAYFFEFTVTEFTVTTSYYKSVCIMYRVFYGFYDGIKPAPHYYLQLLLLEVVYIWFLKLKRVFFVS
jgi:hypothetical protein